jgi:hypothetical protein
MHMSTSVVDAVFSMAMVLLGTPTDLSLRTSDQAPCEARDQTAAAWRKAGHPVFVHELSPWCIVASIQQGAWNAEQWRAVHGLSYREQERFGEASSTTRAYGWRVRIPLTSLPTIGSHSPAQQIAPGVQVQAFRYPGQTVTQAHRQRLAVIAPSVLAALPQSADGLHGGHYRINRLQQAQSVVTLITVQPKGEVPMQIELTESRP